MLRVINNVSQIPVIRMFDQFLNQGAHLTGGNALPDSAEVNPIGTELCRIVKIQAEGVVNGVGQDIGKAVQTLEAGSNVRFGEFPGIRKFVMGFSVCPEDQIDQDGAVIALVQYLLQNSGGFLEMEACVDLPINKGIQ